MYKKFLVFISVLAIAYSSKAQVHVQDSSALIELYNSTDGANWRTKWNLSQPVNTWYGVTVSGGRVTRLSLSNNQLSGTIPGELENLTNLTFLSLFNNQLSGTIPGELENLNNLTGLSLRNNQLSGSIPMELGNLNNLTGLDLSSNQLSGTIPVELSNLTNLTLLYLWNNELSGTIPGELENLNNLTELSLSNNQLSGSIPIELGKLTNLTLLYLWNNELSGSIPIELGKLTNLTELSLSNNQLNGTIPGELENLNNLTLLYLWGNELSGSIPIELGNLTNLTSLDLNDNQFDELPDLSSLTSLITFRVQNNRLDFDDILPNINVLTGYSPQFIREGIRYNTFLGEELTLSVEVGGTNNVYQWYKDNNQLSGATNDNLKLPDIQIADHGLYHCQVTNAGVPNLILQSIPDTVIINGDAPLLLTDSLALIALYASTEGANWKRTWDLSQPASTWHGVIVNNGRVTRLYLSSNQLSGSIPMELGDLTNLTELYLDGNQLSGSIPEELDNLIHLTGLSLGGNELSGSIPVELGNLNNLTELSLWDNELSGTIPVELGKLTNLTGLYLRNNQLSGSIPVELGKLTNLTQLRLNDNQFDELPDLSSLTSLYEFQVQNNRLDFGDILPNIGMLTSYSPQFIREGVRYTPSIGEELTLSVQVEGKNNVYQWYKDNNQLSGATNDTQKLTNIQIANHGLYHCEVTNAGVPDLRLRSIPDTVIVMQRMNNAPTDITLSNTAIEENKVIGTMIGILSTTDLDASDDHIYSLSGTDANSFQIIKDTLKNAAVFDYETKSSYIITIQTEDAGGLTYQKDFTISIDKFTALDELDISNEVTIYPNPSRKNVIIEINNHLIDKGSIKVYSLNGKNERSFPFEKNSVKQIFIFTIADLPSGIYILYGEIGNYYFTERIFKK